MGRQLFALVEPFVTRSAIFAGGSQRIALKVRVIAVAMNNHASEVRNYRTGCMSCGPFLYVIVSWCFVLKGWAKRWAENSIFSLSN